MTEHHFHSASEALVGLAPMIACGEEVAPRGLKTFERRAVGLSIVCAVTHGMPVGVNRGLATALCAVEGAQNLAGESRPQLAIKLVPSLERFADVNDAGQPFFQGAYAPRFRYQMRDVEEQLRKDEFCRQAVVSIWEDQDRDPTWTDRPCGTEFQFLQRNGNLEMFVYMRSNDLFKGFCYDVFQYAQLQAALAHVLGYVPTWYHHFAASLHVYEDEVEQLLACEDDGTGKAQEPNGPPWWQLKPGEYESIEAVQDRYAHLLDFVSLEAGVRPRLRDAAEFVPGNPVEDWYLSRLVARARKVNG